ncbi:SpoIIE family protein phosphatase [Desulfogranum marinum]|uniref:SpoIIE family protein phosphatase n=1 Tax=Desulfogranum marinum TaxID=453220 RepID=UPI00196430E7|nr:SpoIIE family protein phosphatase [Desulfogranum marinum]MBM9514978.1 SpoIIE family protein phosphatase [Desulfogranum marinum]
MYEPKTLHQRTVVFIILPIFLFLTLTGVFGFIAVRNVLVDQWGETALAQLEKAAHNIDMQLNRPKQLLSFLDGMSKRDFETGIHEIIVDRLHQIQGVTEINAEWPNEMGSQGLRMRRHILHRSKNEKNTGKVLGVTPPLYEVAVEQNNVLLSTSLVNMEDEIIGKIELYLDFEQLIAQTIQSKWWNIYKAYIVDQDGHILAQTINNKEQTAQHSTKQFGQSNALEKKTLAALSTDESGIVFGKGIPPAEISGFYRLHQAPWTMVIITPGKKVLQPLIKFRLAYIITALSCITVLLWFIRSSFKQTTQSIKQVSTAADELANGNFSKPFKVSTKDEVGDLLHSFNRMTSQLQRGLQLQKAMEIAKEVQMTLLPQNDYSDKGITASGVSIYCDETGGDYFDFIESETHPGKLHVAVGDVVGHGIGAALLMATLRALLRVRVQKPGLAAERINDVNRYLCWDTLQYGNFASLFYLEIEPNNNTVEWIRAGHEPALLFTPANDTFTELLGKGLVLGLDADIQYKGNTFHLTHSKHILIIGSDGVWDLENEQLERFGKERVKEIIRNNHHAQPAQIIQKIIEEVTVFRGDAEQMDDITLVVISLEQNSLANNLSSSSTLSSNKSIKT